MSTHRETGSDLKLSLTGRVASWSARYRWPVVISTMVVLAVAFFLGRVDISS